MYGENYSASWKTEVTQYNYAGVHVDMTAWTYLRVGEG